MQLDQSCDRSGWRPHTKSGDLVIMDATDSWKNVLDLHGKPQGSWRRVCCSVDVELHRQTWLGQGRVEV